MTFQPVLPIGGFAGWSFINRTRETQQAAFNASPALERNTEYFRQNIYQVQTAEDLVADRRLLEVALGAFGLSEDINNTFFMQKVLEDGTIDPAALGNRLSDKRYLAFSKAFGFGDFGTPRTTFSDFADEIISQYQTLEFETAIGSLDSDMRLAMSFERELESILSEDTTDDGRWFMVMGQPPVRSVFEKALGLPSSFGSLDLDQQLSGFRDKLSARLGNPEISSLADPENRESLIRSFLAQAQIQSGFQGFSSASAALTLLQSTA